MSSVSACPEQSVKEGFLLFPTKCVKQYILYIHIKCDKSCKQCPLNRLKKKFYIFQFINE